MAAAYYDDTRLRKLFGELDPKNRRKALRSAFMREANTLRKSAREKLTREIEASSDVLKGIRSVVFKKSLGFRVTVGTKRARRSGQSAKSARKEIVPLWMQGTDKRWRGSRRKVLKAMRKLTGTRKGYTGVLSHRTYMEDARNERRGTVEESLRRKIIEQIEKTARKYGCTV